MNSVRIDLKGEFGLNTTCRTDTRKSAGVAARGVLPAAYTIVNQIQFCLGEGFPMWTEKLKTLLSHTLCMRAVIKQKVLLCEC